MNSDDAFGVPLYLIGGVVYLLTHYLFVRPQFLKTARTDNWTLTPYASGSGPLFLLLWPIIVVFDGVHLYQLRRGRHGADTVSKDVNVPATLRRLDSITVQHVELRRASLDNIVDYLNVVSRRSNQADGIRGVVAMVDQRSGRPISVMYERKTVSLLQLIKDLAELAEVEYAIYGDRYLVFGSRTGLSNQPAKRRASPCLAGDVGRRP
jgi:hypothetical protein